MIYTDYDQFADIYNRRWGGFARNVVEPLDLLGLNQLSAGDHLVDLCCGSGQLAATLADRHLRITGVDGSEAMIARAVENAPAAEFVVDDARTFVLDEPADMVVSTFDSLNHVMSIEELTHVFERTATILCEGARFVFDMNMEAGYRARWNGSFVIDDDDEFVVAESFFDPETMVGEMKFNWFVPDGDLWDRSALVLTQRCYPEEEIRSALLVAGFSEVMAVDSGALVDGWQEGRSFFQATK